MDLYNLYGMNGYYQTLMAGSGVLGGCFPGSMMASPELTSTYAKFTDALQKAVSERQTNGSGMVVLTEEALARIQKDPAYGKEVMDMLQKGVYGLRVIGGSDKECGGEKSSVKSSSADSHSQKSRWEEQYEQNYDQMRLGMRGSLADRLASNRAGRIQERMAQRQEGSV